jgi:hypothetical protein
VGRVNVTECLLLLFYLSCLLLLLVDQLDTRGLVLFLVTLSLLIDLLLLKERTEEDVVDVVLFEVGAPVLAEFLSEVVGLVDEQEELLDALALVHLLDVLLQVLRVEEVWVACVHDLQEHVRPLNHSPQLSPHLDVLLEGRDREGHVVLLYHSYIPTPLEERYVLIRLDLCG